ncbi:alpha/beta hydrolase [Pedobacter mucosus]|uniref:alpha/beta hydrolase n=1 Tax=Pedobacter mucosus TaxID=2895286 RepID=UPI001EE4C5A3|nr:alpha/beta hydrolase [Pedobacter mucosus]UKT63032.1 alpha/beta hydrolase [Pedobacter mucosus]
MKTKSTLLAAFITLMIMAGCSKNKDNNNEIIPKGAKPSWGPDITPEMQVVIEKLASFNDTPIPQLTAVQARKNHTATDAVVAVMNDYHITAPIFNADTIGKEIPVTGGTVHIRVYTPKATSGALPVIVYYHGGGFVIANIDVYDTSARLLSANTGAIVVSVAYRLAPEYKFPTAHNDAYEAYNWVIQNAASINADVNKIALSGESAGGNLALATAMKARDNGLKMPVAILSIYPVAGADTNTASYIKYADAKPLDKPSLLWFFDKYLNTPAEAMDTRLNLVNANLAGLPPVTIINAELDPLQTEGATLVEKLKAAGVNVDRQLYTGVTHEFFGMGAVVPTAKTAEDYAVAQLKKAFGK